MKATHELHFTEIIFHFFILLGIPLFFWNNSFLRPLADGAVYKELLSALIVLLMLYINYFIIIPRFFLKKKYGLFFLYSLLSIVLATVMEIILVAPNIRTCYPPSLTENEIQKLIMKSTLMVGFRNAAFFMLFFVVKILKNEIQLLEKERNALMKLRGELCISNGKEGMSIINISEIFFISHERNYTYIYTQDGCKYCQYVSLSKMEKILPNSLFFRINKNIIIPITRITDYTETSVTISGGNPVCEHTFYLSCKYVSDIKDKIKKNVGLKSKSVGLNGDFVGINSENDGLKKIDLEEFKEIIAKDEDLLQLCKQLAVNQSINMKKFSETKGVSLRTIERKMQYLKENNVIQHEGARKNGNYAFTPYLSEEVMAWLKTIENDLPAIDQRQTQE